MIFDPIGYGVIVLRCNQEVEDQENRDMTKRLVAMQYGPRFAGWLWPTLTTPEPVLTDADKALNRAVGVMLDNLGGK